jgi:hypothetical protein
MVQYKSACWSYCLFEVWCLCSLLWGCITILCTKICSLVLLPLWSVMSVFFTLRLYYNIVHYKICSLVLLPLWSVMSVFFTLRLYYNIVHYKICSLVLLPLWSVMFVFFTLRLYYNIVHYKICSLVLPPWWPCSYLGDTRSYIIITLVAAAKKWLIFVLIAAPSNINEEI